MPETFGGCDDELLVIMTLNGDIEAYSEIVNRYKNLVLHVTMSMVKNYHVAEDIVQESFIDGYLKLKTLKDKNKISSWLCRISKNKSYNHLTRSQKTVDLELTEPLLAVHQGTPENQLIESEIITDIDKAIGQLSDKIRSVVILYYFRGCSQQKIAAILEIPLGTVKRRLHDARVKLKKELEFMTENNYKLSDGFEEKIVSKIKQLQNYYHLHGYSYDGFDNKYNEVLSMLKKMPVSQKKHNAYADVYLSAYYRSSCSDKDLYNKIMRSAVQGNNADAICSLLVEEYIKIQDANTVIKRIDEEAIPRMKEMGSNRSIGIFLFWKGAYVLRKKETDSAVACFQNAVQLLDKTDIYYANTIAALRGVDIIRNHTQGLDHSSYVFCGEGLKINRGTIQFINQPGFGNNYGLFTKQKYSFLLYHISRCDGILINDRMKVGDIISNKDKYAVLEVIEMDISVGTAAGNFMDCIHLKYHGNYKADIWYSKNVGLIKACFDSHNSNEAYELLEYKLNGGSGYLPLCIGNQWRYKLSELTEPYYQLIEREIISFDGEYANFSAINILAFSKNSEGAHADSDLFIHNADKLCDNWEIDKAIENLKIAAQLNSTQEAASIALAGIDYLKRCKHYMEKKYRFCPSSLNGSLIGKKDGTVVYDEAGLYSFGPYRFGTRHEENKIFGMKPFRYLDQLFGRIYDEKWIDGYAESRNIDEESITAQLKVENCGTVTVKAGSFDHCIKVTIEAELDGADESYYFRNFSHVYCGKKVYWYAPSVGIIKHECIWGTSLNSICELTEYNSVATNSEYMPVYPGSKWVYDEMTLEEGYRARRTYSVASGVGDRYFLIDEQEFLYLGLEEEYEQMKTQVNA